MARNLDEFAGELTQVTAQVIQAATASTKARDLKAAAHRGDQAEVHRIANSMTTDQLKDLKKRLEN